MSRAGIWDVNFYLLSDAADRFAALRRCIYPARSSTAQIAHDGSQSCCWAALWMCASLYLVSSAAMIDSVAVSSATGRHQSRLDLWSSSQPSQCAFTCAPFTFPAWRASESLSFVCWAGLSEAFFLQLGSSMF
jgi:hypothetical protein